MPELLQVIIRDPGIALGAALIAALTAAFAWAAFPITLIALRRRLDRIESAQAETAAYVGTEFKRLGAMIGQQQANQIGEALRRSQPEAAPLSPAVVQSSADKKLAEKLGCKAVTLPLRKTVH